MGYTKIVQYGDTIEYYFYEKNLIKKEKQSHLKFSKILNPKQKFNAVNSKKLRKKAITLLNKKSGHYERTPQSIKRSRDNFFRLCHHNNCLASSIHFLTLTFAYDITFKTASRHVRRFMEKLKKHCGKIPISYISVPETTKKGRYHFHLLVYNLPTEIAGDPISVRRYNKRKKRWQVDYTTTERFTRNIQRLFERGFVDISPTTHNSAGIAGYMAKYMGKNLTDGKSESQRGYTCSRNIDKITSYGSNTLNTFTDLDFPQQNDVKEQNYEVPWLGSCKKIVITRK